MVTIMSGVVDLKGQEVWVEGLGEGPGGLYAALRSALSAL